MTDARRRLRLPKGLRPIARALAEEAARRGLPAYAVGGCVRDWCLGRPTKDLDIVLESDPLPLARWCAERLGGKAESFDRFGTVRVQAKGRVRLDFARARAEDYPGPAALPVVRPATLAQDLARRDFAVNAMAARLGGSGLGALVDPLGGSRDLARGVARILHAQSFRDDPTRLYRAARFTARFGFKLDAETDRLRREALAQGLPKLLSRERLRGELWRMLEERNPHLALSRARNWGLAAYWHPRFRWPSDLAFGRDPLERLALIALHMGPKEGGELIRSLNLERPQTQAVLATLDVAQRRASPRAKLPPVALSVLQRRFKPPKGALRPLIVNGGDLQDLGLEPGPRFSKLLDQAARAQWSGAFATKPAAVRWLRAAVGSKKKKRSPRSAKGLPGLSASLKHRRETARIR